MRNGIASSAMKVRGDDLLTKIEENRIQHIAEYKEAEEGYWAELQEKHEEALAAVKEREEPDRVYVPKPQSHEEDYDRAIMMLQMTSSDEILLDEQRFSQWVLDEWDWTHDFITTNSLYAGKAASL